MSNDRGTLAATEPHPAAHSAIAWIRSLPLEDLVRWQAAFASTAIEGNRMAEVCGETLRRLLAGEPVSDRYTLGLAWAMRHDPRSPAPTRRLQKAISGIILDGDRHTVDEADRMAGEIAALLANSSPTELAG